MEESVDKATGRSQVKVREWSRLKVRERSRSLVWSVHLVVVMVVWMTQVCSAYSPMFRELGGKYISCLFISKAIA